MSHPASQAVQSITNRRVLKIALPIMVSNATVPILGVVDTGVIGQLGEAAPIGAVGLGAAIIGLVYWLFGFLRMGTTGLVAQAKGAHDEAETGAILMRAMLIAWSAGLFFLIFQIPVLWAAFKLAPASAQVEEMTRAYLQIRLWGAPFAISVYALSGWLIATERTPGLLAVQIVMNGLNMLLDLWFVIGLGWGIEGVAIATVISEITGFILGLYLCRTAFAGAQWRNWVRVFDRARIKVMMQVNTDIMIRTLILQLGFTGFMFLSARQGDLSLASNQILLQFMMVICYALDGFALAAESLVGQAKGAGNRPMLRRAVYLAGYWIGGMALVMSVILVATGGLAIDIMTTAPDVREHARAYIFWIGIGPIAGVLSWLLDGVFIGATRTRDMRNAMIHSGLIYLVAILLLVPMFGTDGLWASLMIFFAARGITLALRYPALERDVDKNAPA